MSGLSATWSCSMCTFENVSQDGKCAICLTDRVLSASASSVEQSPVASMRTKTPPTKKKKQQQTSMLVAVGSSREKETQRVRRKIEQMQEMGIDLPREELLQLLARNCYCVHVAASAYFEQCAMAEPSQSGASMPLSMQQSEVERIEKMMEMRAGLVSSSFRLLGSMTMAATVARAGAQLQAGDGLLFQAEDAGKKRLRPGASGTSVSGVVRISTMQHSQVAACLQ